MNVEQQEIVEFFQKHAPLNSLTQAQLQLVLANLEISYFKAGSPILSFDEPANYWFVIRSGAVEVFRRDGQLYNRLCEGGYFGEFGLLRGNKVRFPAKALEDTLCYMIPASIFITLFDESEPFASYVEIEDNTRLKQAVSRQQQSNVLFTANIHSLISAPPVPARRHPTAGSCTENGGSQPNRLDCARPARWCHGHCGRSGFSRSGGGPRLVLQHACEKHHDCESPNRDAQPTCVRGHDADVAPQHTAFTRVERR